MELIEHLKTMSAGDRGLFAQRCQTTDRHLTNVAYGYKPCGIALAVAVEKESKGLVTRKRLRPHDYWLIWPDLPAPNSPESGGIKQAEFDQVNSVESHQIKSTPAKQEVGHG